MDRGEREQRKQNGVHNSARRNALQVEKERPAKKGVEAPKKKKKDAARAARPPPPLRCTRRQHKATAQEITACALGVQLRAW